MIQLPSLYNCVVPDACFVFFYVNKYAAAKEIDPYVLIYNIIASHEAGREFRQCNPRVTALWHVPAPSLCNCVVLDACLVYSMWTSMQQLNKLIHIA